MSVARKPVAEFSDASLVTLRERGDQSPMPRVIVIENDNPCWMIFVRVAVLIRDTSEGGVDALKLQGMGRGADDCLEYRLPVGRHCLRWNGSTFYVDLRSEESKEEVVIRLADDEGCLAFEDFMRHAKEYTRRKSGAEVDKIVVKVLRGGLWRTVSTYPKRDRASLITGDDTIKELLDDMQAFVKAEADYLKFGMPFKRNYLITGPAGAGKSSLVTLAASLLDFDVCFISVTPNMTERELCAAVTALTDNSMLVLEDVDILCSTAKGGSTSAPTALAVLTNILDGTLHRHKLITVLTSTNPQELDPVLMRRGRIDFTSRLHELSETQVRLMVIHAFGDTPEASALATRIWEPLKTVGVSSTVVAHFLFQHRAWQPADITADVCRDFLLSGTHTEFVGDTVVKNHPSGFYM